MTEKERQKELTFKIYATDTLKHINESIANVFGGKVMKLRFADMIKDQPEGEEERTPEEIINNISSKLEKMRQNNERI